MAKTARAKVGKKGQVTLPHYLREELGIEPGDQVAVRSFAGGILISKGALPAQAEAVLRHLLIGIGEAAERRGIREDEDLDSVIEEIREEVYRERYGG